MLSSQNATFQNQKPVKGYKQIYLEKWFRPQEKNNKYNPLKKKLTIQKLSLYLDMTEISFFTFFVFVFHIFS